MNIRPCFGGLSSQGDLYPVPRHARVAAQLSPLVSKVNGLFEHLKSPRAGEPKIPLNFASPQLSQRLAAVLNQKKPVLQVLRRVFGQGQASAAKEKIKTDAAEFVAKAVGVLLANQCQVTPEAIQSVLREIRGTGSHPSFNAPSWSRYIDKAIAEVQKSVPAQVSQSRRPRAAEANDEPFFEFKSSNGHRIALPATAKALFAGVLPEHIKILAEALESKIDHEMTVLKNGRMIKGEDWRLYIEKNNIALRWCASFCADASLEPLGQVPAFVAQLVKAKLEGPMHYSDVKAKGAVRTKTLVQLFKEEEQTTIRHVAIHQKLPEIVESEVHSVLPKQAQVSLSVKESRRGSGNKFRGEYIKKESLSGVKHTRVKAASGQVYALLNKLSPDAAKALKRQHNIDIIDSMDKQGKVMLGRGGFGKVRLAMNVGTGRIVAVKKFLPDEQKAVLDRKGRLPDVEANKELNRFDCVTERLKGRESTNLASYLDYAHVTLPHIKRANGERAGKSYIFMDLANAGDGKKAMGRLAGFREAGHPKKAQSLLVHIAKNYTQALADLHQLGLAHRDVKPANFLHTKTNENEETIRLTDFGFLSQKEDDHRYSGQGTPGYLPPEAKTHYSAKAHDAFSLGVTLNKLWEAAFGAETHEARSSRASSDETLFILDAAIHGLMHPDPTDRTSVADALEQLQYL